MSTEQVRADELKAGDRLQCADGTFIRVARIETASWIRTGDGKTCLELFASRQDRHGHILGRGDLVIRKKG